MRLLLLLLPCVHLEVNTDSDLIKNRASSVTFLHNLFFCLSLGLPPLIFLPDVAGRKRLYPDRNSSAQKSFVEQNNARYCII